MKLIQGKQGLVRDIGRFGKARVREIGIPLYLQIEHKTFTGPPIAAMKPHSSILFP